MYVRMYVNTYTHVIHIYTDTSYVHILVRDIVSRRARMHTRARTRVRIYTESDAPKLGRHSQGGHVAVPVLVQALYMYRYMYMYACAYVYVCTYVCMYACMYVHMHTHIHTHAHTCTCARTHPHVHTYTV